MRSRSSGRKGALRRALVEDALECCRAAGRARGWRASASIAPWPPRGSKPTSARRPGRQSRSASASYRRSGRPAGVRIGAAGPAAAARRDPLPRSPAGAARRVSSGEVPSSRWPGPREPSPAASGSTIERSCWVRRQLVDAGEGDGAEDRKAFDRPAAVRGRHRAVRAKAVVAPVASIQYRQQVGILDRAAGRSASSISRVGRDRATTRSTDRGGQRGAEPGRGTSVATASSKVVLPASLGRRPGSARRGERGRRRASWWQEVGVRRPRRRRWPAPVSGATI